MDWLELKSQFQTLIYDDPHRPFIGVNMAKTLTYNNLHRPSLTMTYKDPYLR